MQEIKVRKNLKSFDSNHFDAKLKSVREQEPLKKGLFFSIVKIFVGIGFFGGLGFGVWHLYHNSDILRVSVALPQNLSPYQMQELGSEVNEYLNAPAFGGSTSQSFFLAFSPQVLTSRLLKSGTFNTVSVIKLNKAMAYEVKSTQKTHLAMVKTNDKTAIFYDDGSKAYEFSSTLAKTLGIVEHDLPLFELKDLPMPERFDELSDLLTLKEMIGKKLFIRSFTVAGDETQNSTDGMMLELVVSENVKNGDFTVRAVDTENPAQLSDKIQGILSHLKFGQRVNLEYIDLRYQNKAFVCVKNTPCSEDVGTDTIKDVLTNDDKKQ